MMRALVTALLASTVSSMSVLAPGAKVAVVGGGPIQCLAARLSALGGFDTTIALPEQELATAKRLMFDDTHPEGSMPLTLMPISGPNADSPTIEACVESIEGLIICFDNEQAFMPEAALKIFTSGDKLKHVSLMSRYLNGDGMGFFANAAKVAANSEIWAATDALVKQFKQQDAQINGRAKEIGASCTIIRAGTLKGGASADAALEGGSGEPALLNPYLYSLGQQDVVNWRLLFDCASLGVEIKKGDTMPGPGFTAAVTATADKAGAGDSSRAGIARALVEAMRTEAAQDMDFSIAAKESTSFPTPEQFATLFTQAA